MRTKSYFASSVQQALSQARRELGDEAMLVTCRPASPSMRNLGEHEVVLAVDGPEDEKPIGAQPDVVPRTPPSPALPASARMETGMTESLVSLFRQCEVGAGKGNLSLGPSLTQAIDRICSAVDRPAPAAPVAGPPTARGAGMAALGMASAVGMVSAVGMASAVGTPAVVDAAIATGFVAAIGLVMNKRRSRA
jgi:hypothetical protein